MAAPLDRSARLPEQFADRLCAPDRSTDPGLLQPPGGDRKPGLPGDGAVPSRRVGLWDFSKNAFHPRVGLAYRATDKTVVRSGFGIYGDEPLGGMIYGALGGTRNPRANAGQQTYNGSVNTPDLPLSNPFSGNVPGGGLPRRAVSRARCRPGTWSTMDSR